MNASSRVRTHQHFLRETSIIGLCFIIVSACGGRDPEADVGVDADDDEERADADDVDYDGDREQEEDATPDADQEADAETHEPLFCEPEYGPYTPVGTDDVLYDSWDRIACLGDKCLCDDVAHEIVERVLSCDAVFTGLWWGFGEIGIRVLGRQDGDCVINFYDDMEGYARILDCRLPLPIVPWEGLSLSTDVSSVHFFDGIEDRCTQTGECCIDGFCGLPDCFDLLDRSSCFYVGGTTSCDD